MKTIIAGSREGVKLEDVERAVAACGWKITTIVSGTAMGADRSGERVCQKAWHSCSTISCRMGVIW